MDEALPLSKNELELLSALIKHRVSFMVVGLSAAALQGAPVVTEDIDLWFENLADPRLAQALRKVGAAYVPPYGLNPPMLAGAGCEPFDIVLRMDGLGTFDEEAQYAKTVRVGPLRLKLLSLDRILVSKRAANREKDKRVIPALENAVRTLSVITQSKSRTSMVKPRRKK